MRSASPAAFLVALASLASLVLAGCSSAPEPATDAPVQADPALVIQETDVTFSDDAAGPSAVAYGREEFEVPEGTVSLSGEAEWTCLTLCRLDIRLVAPDGTAAFEDSRGSGATMDVEDPEAGTWAFEWGAGEGASVGVDGTLHLTFERLA